MTNIKQITIILITLFLLNGCALINENNNAYKFKYLHSTAVTNFSDLAEDLLDDIDESINGIDMQRYRSDALYVTDFVNLQSLQNHSELGFILSDELKTLVTQKYDWPIQQLEYTKYLKIGENGTRLLSRNLKDIKHTKVNKNSYALIGTYTFTQRQLILYLKLVEIETGIIIKAATKRTEITDEIIHLEQKNKGVNPSTIYQPMVL